MQTCSELTACGPETCRRACAREVIDALLREHGAVRGEEVDLLLELRWLVRHREQAEETVRLFCDLRRRLEETHYLLFYRLRRWLENNLEVVVRGSAEPVKVPLKLEFYCLEAILASSVGELRRQGLLTTADSKVVLAYHAHEPALLAAG